MTNTLDIPTTHATAAKTFWRLIIAMGAVLLFQFAALAQPQISSTADDQTIIIDEAPEMEVVAFGKSVVVRVSAKGVLAFGGDIVIEGNVEGDVAAIGGSVIQKENAFIGGDVFVFGGTYKPESDNPKRNAEKETVMFGVFEDELRELAQDPSQILTPDFTLAFLAQRLLSVLFWFIVTLVTTTLAPGSVSRSIARFHLSTLKIVGLGFLAFVLTTVGVVSLFTILPDYINVVVGLMAFTLLMLAYVFGRAVLQVSTGKLIQKYLFSDKNQSETLAILIGVVVWAVLLSLPYIWTLALLMLFSAGLGFVLTARTPNGWKTR